MRDLSPHLALIDQQNSRWLDLLRRWCGICSGSYHVPGLKTMADELAGAFSELGDLQRTNLPPTVLIDPGGNEVTKPLGQALSIIKRPHAALRVLLLIHYDTVYSPEDPFNAVSVLPDGTWNGPGVVDAKGGLVVMLAALHALEASPFAQDIGWEVVLNPDEEIGSPGSSTLLSEAAKRNHLGLLFEPALPDGALVGARKGSGNFTIVVHGRAAHAGRDFAAGRSAVVALADIISKGDQQAAALGGGVTLNCGQISGGGAVNVVPDLAIARFNARVSEPAEVPMLQELLQKLTEESNQRDGITASLHGSFSSPPKPLDARSLKLLQAVADCGSGLGMDLPWRSTGGTCDGNRIAAAGLPVVDTLGPVGGNLHSPREYVVPATISQRAKLTASLIMRLAAGDFGKI